MFISFFNAGLLSCFRLAAAFGRKNPLQLHLRDRRAGMYCYIRATHFNGNKKCQLLRHSQRTRLLHSSNRNAFSVIHIGLSKSPL